MSKMSNINFYLFAKKIHRLLVLVVSILAVIMISTGLFIDFPQARIVHSLISKLFAAVLVLMAASGLTMYFYPWFKK